MPTSMLDWPGRLATTVFIAGCDLRCPFCQNPDLVVARDCDSQTLSELFSHLYNRRDWIDGLVVTGGEPTTDPNLLGFLEAVHETGVEIKLDTNGNNPDALSRVLDSGLVSYVAMDIKATYENYSEATGGRGSWQRADRSIRLIRESGLEYEFRTTVYPRFVSRTDLPRIAESIQGARMYALQQFRPQKTLASDASGVKPMNPDQLVECASACSRYLPTITRGV
ncbi:MAG: anaerobic ribonucleoside-triphosphate reductase activating protein [Actinomycetota bacterium]|nr:anaerobic ribonucleoside-triphosphate reductase activating protein [Actinomycetota bacterium]